MAAAAPVHCPREKPNFDEVPTHQSVVLSDSLKDLKNLSKQLYSAAEYFELSYANDDQKHIVVSTLKDYAIKALVNTVDHLGSVSYKVNDLLDAKVDLTRTMLRVSCIEQRLRTCQDYIDREGLSQQSLVISTPKHHKRYILPVGEAGVEGATGPESKYQGCSLDEGDDWGRFKNAIRATINEPTPPAREGNSVSSSPKRFYQSGKFTFSYSMPGKEFEKRRVSPHQYPLLRTASFSSKLPTPKGSRASTPNRSRPTTPNPSLARQMYNSAEPGKSASMRIHTGKESPKDMEQNLSKSKRLLKALLSRGRSKKDDTLFTYLDEY